MNNDQLEQISNTIRRYLPFIPLFIISFLILGIGGILVLFGADIDSFISSPSPDTQSEIEQGGETQVTFLRENQEQINIIAEVASTPEERQIGLMFRETLEFDRGMIFVFPTSMERQFWMKDTLIPLDIIFVNGNKEIIKIHKNAIPNNTELRYPSEGPTKYAIEVNGGWTDFYDIREGDKVAF